MSQQKPDSSHQYSQIWRHAYRMRGVFSLAAPRGIWDLSWQTRDRTHAPWLEKLNHWTTREVLPREFFFFYDYSTHLLIYSWLVCTPILTVGKELPASAGDTGEVRSIPGSGRYPGGENGNPLHNPRLGNIINRGDWWAIIHGVPKSWTQLSMHAPTHSH